MSSRLSRQRAALPPGSAGRKKPPDYATARWFEFAQLDFAAALQELQRVVEEHIKVPHYHFSLDLSRQQLGSLLAENPGGWKEGTGGAVAETWMKQAAKTLETASLKADAAAPAAGEIRLGWRTLGFAYAKEGLWAEAAVFYDRGRGPAGGESWDNQWHHVFKPALARLLNGDMAGYRQICAEIRGCFEKSQQPDPISTWACTLSGRAEIDPAQLVKWTELAVAPLVLESWRRHILALAYFRAGRFEEALSHAIHSNSDNGWPQPKSRAGQATDRRLSRPLALG